MKPQQSSEFRLGDSLVAARATLGRVLASGGVLLSLRVNHRAPRPRLPYNLATLAFLASVLPPFADTIVPVAAAQPATPGRTDETGAALGSLERLRLSLALARSYRLAGQPQKALETLQPLSGGPWPSTGLEVDYHDEVARDEDALGRPSEALSELKTAVALEPTAERRFRLGQLADRLGDREEARRQIEAAAAAEPGNTEYKAALAYLLRRSGELAEAARLLAEILSAEPKRYALHEDLGYIYLGLGENQKAIEQFKWAIDNRQVYPVETSEERTATERKMEALRETISSVEPHWTALAYSNLCLSGNYCSRRTTNLGSLISANQGGIEIAYQPPGIGYVDGRTFQGFARTYFNYEPGTIDPQGKSFQGGVGIRYKPLRDYNLVLSGERLIKLGSNAQNNWLARAAFSTSRGYAGYIVEPVAGRSRYSLFYIDLATTVASPHQYLTYADAREGLNFTLADRLVASPFVYGIFRGNYGVGPNTSAEAGLGVSLRGFFEEDEYHAPRPIGDWRQLVDELRTIGINNLFLQWTVADRKAYFQTARFETPVDTPLPYILELAAHGGIRVWIGLATDTYYWEEIKQSPDLLRTYFHKRLQDLAGFLGDLDTTLAGPQFAGWYIPDEIDDRTWLEPTKRTILKKYLADTVKPLKTRRPASRVAISGFSNSFAEPDQLASFWAEVIEGSGIDLLLFQDGVGEGKVALEDIGLYYGPLNSAVRRAGAQLGAVVELFSRMPNGQRVPAMVARIREQIAAADRATSFPPVAFSVPDYMSSLAGQQADGLLANFLAAQKRCRG